jgi:hypothetical protein
MIMKKNAATEKSGKMEVAKKRFLKELKKSIEESGQASRGEIKLRSLDEVASTIERRHGGKRQGAGRKPNEVKKVTHGVKLTQEEHQAIIKKYGSFAKAVRSLIPKEPVNTKRA